LQEATEGMIKDFYFVIFIAFYSIFMLLAACFLLLAVIGGESPTRVNYETIKMRIYCQRKKEGEGFH